MKLFTERKEKTTVNEGAYLNASQIFSFKNGLLLNLDSGLFKRFRKKEWLKRVITKEFMDHVSQWHWKQDPVQVNNRIGLSVASAFYGIHSRTPAEIVQRARQLSDFPVDDKTVGSGFTELFQIHPGLTDEQLFLTQMMAAQRLISTSTEAINKKPKDIDLLIIATSMPIHHQTDKRIAQAIGMLENKPTLVYIKACDSSGSALFDVNSGKHDELIKTATKGKRAANICIFAFENAGSKDAHGVDSTSRQLFSSAASAVTFTYDMFSRQYSTFSLITGKTFEVMEGNECLKVKKTYVKWPKREGIFFAPNQIEPETGRAVDMNPRTTPIFFKKHLLAFIPQVIQEYEQQHPHAVPLSKRVKKVFMHHPSATIFRHVVEAMVGNEKKTRGGLGFTESQFKWVITEGNSPAVTLPLSLGRGLEELQPYDVIMCITFGAGGSFTIAFYQLGGFK